jgi:glyoxalase family protein
MDLTFFEYPGAVRGTPGAGMVHRIVWRVGSVATLDFWAARLADARVQTERGTEGISGAESLRFADPEGLDHELAVYAGEDPPLHATAPGIPPEHALQGFAGVRVYSAAPADSASLLGETLGFTGEDGDATRWEVRGDRRGSFYSEDEEAWRARVTEGAARPTQVIDRFYFRSIYFREPSGVLFEIATIGPGFAVDEDAAHLGERLSLPPRFEPLRERLDEILAPLPYPRPQSS